MDSRTSGHRDLWGFVFRFPPFFLLAQRWLLSFRFFFGFPLCRSVSRQEVQDGKVSRLLVFTFRFLHRGERREEEALRVPFLVFFFVVVFCAFCVWVSCACCWPSVLQLVSLAFFCCILHRKRIILNGGSLCWLPLYGICFHCSKAIQSAWFAFFFFRRSALLWPFFLFYLRTWVQQQQLESTATLKAQERSSSAQREVQIRDPCVCRCFCIFRFCHLRFPLSSLAVGGVFLLASFVVA